MQSLNEVTLLGRMTDAPVSHTIGEAQTIASNFTVATNRKYRNKNNETVEDSQFTLCSAYGPVAKILGEHGAKGKSVLIKGRLDTQNVEKDGVSSYITKVIVSDFVFPASR